MRRAAAALRRWAGGVHWFLREVSGEADYDRYVEHHRQAHPAVPALSPRQFQHSVWQRRADRPSGGCC